MLWPAVSRLERYPEMEVGSGFRAVVYLLCVDKFARLDSRLL